MSRSKTRPPLIPPARKPPAPPAPPTSKTVVVTKEQAESLARHQAEAQIANQFFNKVLEGVLAGHGYANANVTDFDPVKRTLTFQVRPAAPPAPI